MFTSLSEWRPAPTSPDLPDGEVHVWRLDLDLPGERLRALERCLVPDEIERADRFHFRRDRDRFVAARGCLRQILGRYLGLRPERLRFSYGPYGKPDLEADHSSARERLFFNLSHSGGAGLAAVACGRRVGVDIESIRPDFAGEEIARRFFSTGEVAALLALPRSEQTQAFFACWTRKEAYIKAIGEGLSMPLDRFDVALAPGEPAALLATRPDPEEARRWSLYSLAPGPGFAAALAVEGRPSSLKGWRWEPDW